jgi:hypothetical protein
MVFSPFRLYDKRVYGLKILQADYGVAASGSKYKAAVAFSGLGVVGYAVGIPAVAIWFLWNNRKRLHNSDFAEKWSFLYQGYGDGRWYWESVVLMRKVALIMVKALATEPFVQVSSLKFPLPHTVLTRSCPCRCTWRCWCSPPSSACKSTSSRTHR